MFVVGMGERKTPKPFVKACDTFKILEIIAQGKETMGGSVKEEIGESVKEEITGLEEIQDAVEKVVTENNNKGKPTQIAEVGSMLSKKFSDFDVRNYGFTKLSTFLEGLEKFELEKKGSTYFVRDKQTTVPRKEIEKQVTALIAANGGQIDNLSVIYEELKKRYSGFNVNQYGYSRLSSFIRSFSKFEIRDNVVRMQGK